MHWTDSRLRACEMTVALSVLLSAPPMQGRRTKETYFRQSDNSLHVALRLEAEYPMSLKYNSRNNNNNRSS